MAGKRTLLGELALKMLDKFPTYPTRTLAQKLYKENKKLFNDVEHARVVLRRYRGAAGKKNRKSMPTKTHLNDKVSFNMPESHADSFEPFKIRQSRTLIISDLHIPYHDTNAIKLAIKYGKQKNVNCILINGDLIDFHNQSRFEKDPRARSTHEELEAARQFLRELRRHFPNAQIVYKYGNHCFDKETEILTSDGWKNKDEISTSDSFATLNTITNRIEFQKSEKIHKYNYDGEMIGVSSLGVDMLVTNKHRLYLKYGAKYKIMKADELNPKSKRVTFRVSGTQNNPEIQNITDDEIRICAWIHTDGSIKKTDGANLPIYILYQRKSKVHLITEILDRLGYKYSCYERDRRISQICGKTLKKPNDISCQLIIQRGRVKSKKVGMPHRLDELLKDKYTLPEWVYKLSNRQFDIWLSSIIDGDGCRHTKDSVALYGMKTFLDQVQHACILHGYRATISEYRPNTFRLNIFKTDCAVVDKFYSKYRKEWYKGEVFCVTVPNGTVIVRRNGKVHVSGNCERYEKWLYLRAPELFDCPEFELNVLLRLGELNIQHVKGKRPIKIGKLTALHGHELQGSSGGVNPSRSTFLKTMENVLVGHYHRTSSHAEPTLYGSVIVTNSMGCLCDLHPQYAPINKHNLGFAYVELNLKNGNYNLHNLKILNGEIFQ